VRGTSTRGAIGNKNGSSCSYATINKNKIGQRCARCLGRRWRHNGSPGGIVFAVVGVAAMTTMMWRRQRQRHR
jgi:hypothetical protein